MLLLLLLCVCPTFLLIVSPPLVMGWVVLVSVHPGILVQFPVVPGSILWMGLVCVPPSFLWVLVSGALVVVFFAFLLMLLGLLFAPGGIFHIASCMGRLLNLLCFSVFLVCWGWVVLWGGDLVLRTCCHSLLALFVLCVGVVVVF